MVEKLRDLEPLATVLTSEGAMDSSYPAVVLPGARQGRLVFEVLRRRPVIPDSVRISVLEQHPHSVQTFIPLKVQSWLVALAPSNPDGSPDTQQIKWAVAGKGDAICIHRNVWHAPLTVFGEEAEFAMIMWRVAHGEDGLVHQLKMPVDLNLPNGWSP